LNEIRSSGLTIGIRSYFELVKYEKNNHRNSAQLVYQYVFRPNKLPKKAAKLVKKTGPEEAQYFHVRPPIGFI